MTNPTTIVFDLGGVLIDWDPRYLYRKLLPDESTVERFLAEICTHDWNVMQDAGRTVADAVAERTARFPHHGEHIEAYYGRWEEMLGGSLEPTVAILARLREAQVPLYALTNWSAETFPVAQARFDFLDWFHGTVVSGHEGLIKPDRRLFEVLMSRYGLQASDTVFIDDSPRNVAGAEAVGMRALHYTTAEALEADLRALGFLDGP